MIDDAETALYDLIQVGPAPADDNVLRTVGPCLDDLGESDQLLGREPRRMALRSVVQQPVLTMRVEAMHSFADRVPELGLAAVAVTVGRGLGRDAPQAAMSGSRQSDEEIIAEGGDGLECHLAGALNVQFVVLLQQDADDGPGDDLLVRKVSDDLRSAIDLAVEPLERFVECSFARCWTGEAHVCRHVRIAVIYKGGELRDLSPELVGEAAPLLAGAFGVVLGEGRARRRPGAPSGRHGRARSS